MLPVISTVPSLGTIVHCLSLYRLSFGSPVITPSMSSSSPSSSTSEGSSPNNWCIAGTYSSSRLGRTSGRPHLKSLRGVSSKSITPHSSPTGAHHPHHPQYPHPSHHSHHSLIIFTVSCSKKLRQSTSQVSDWANIDRAYNSGPRRTCPSRRHCFD